MNDVWPVPPLPIRSGVINVSAPALENVLVAVAPKYAGPYELNSEVEALAND